MLYFSSVPYSVQIAGVAATHATCQWPGPPCGTRCACRVGPRVATGAFEARSQARTHARARAHAHTSQGLVARCRRVRRVPAAARSRLPPARGRPAVRGARVGGAAAGYRGMWSRSRPRWYAAPACGQDKKCQSALAAARCGASCPLDLKWPSRILHCAHLICKCDSFCVRFVRPEFA